MNTAHPSYRKDIDKHSIKQWAIDNDWQKLEIIDTKQGSQEDNSGEVEFKVHYIDKKGRLQVHHERSSFERISGKWYYEKGILDPSFERVKPKRNDPCSCGSGKKYKKCCGNK